MAKQNKFTQSVMERLEQEAKLQKTQKDEEKKTEKPEVENKREEVSAPKAVEPKVEKPKEVKKQAQVPDLSNFITQTPQRVAKNKTFYLDEDVINALRTAAKSQKTTDSRLCNDILRTVLGLDN